MRKSKKRRTVKSAKRRKTGAAGRRPRSAVKRRSTRRKSPRAKKARRAKAARPRRRPALRRSRSSRGESATLTAPSDARGLGAEAAGQSGDTEGLSRAELADSESVEELVEEGQAFEADLIDAVENAPDGEVRTREVPEDDVPQEYLDED
ncbi:MAG TPA: hypothetical protein VJA66_06635 [Thermoanaerobaculia bacterium]